MHDNESKTREFFTTFSRDWYEWISSDIPFAKYPNVRLPKTVRHLSEQVPDKQSVLDVGCGNGVAFAHLADLGFKQIHGLDFSPEMVGLAKKTAEQVADRTRILVQEGEIDSVYPGEHYFDAVIALGVAMYVNEVKAFLRSLARVLKPGGVACLDFRNKAFNMFSTNAYTAGLIQADLQALISEFAERLAAPSGNRIHVDTECLTSFASQTGLEKVPLEIDSQTFSDQVKEKDWNKPFTMQRTQHTPKEVEELVSDSGLRLVLVDYYHFHPFPPVFEQAMPQLFNWLGCMFEQFGTTPVGFIQASAFLAILRKE